MATSATIEIGDNISLEAQGKEQCPSLLLDSKKGEVTTEAKAINHTGEENITLKVAKNSISIDSEKITFTAGENTVEISATEIKLNAGSHTIIVSSASIELEGDSIKGSAPEIKMG